METHRGGRRQGQAGKQGSKQLSDRAGAQLIPSHSSHVRLTYTLVRFVRNCSGSPRTHAVCRRRARWTRWNDLLLDGAARVDRLGNMKDRAMDRARRAAAPAIPCGCGRWPGACTRCPRKHRHLRSARRRRNRRGAGGHAEATAPRGDYPATKTAMSSDGVPLVILTGRGAQLC